MPSYEFNIGLYYLRSRKRTSLFSVMSMISICGVLVGVMALVVALAFASGFQSALKDKLIGINAHLLLLHYDGYIENWPMIKDKLHQIPGVATTMPFTYHQALLRSQNNVAVTVVRGVTPDILQELSGRELIFRCGDFSSLLPEPASEGPGGPAVTPIMIGKALAEKLDVTCGDSVNLIALSKEAKRNGDNAAAFGRYRISGVFEIGFYEYDASLAFLSLPEAQLFFRMGNRVTGVEIELKDINLTTELEDEVQKALGYHFWIKTWKEIHSNFFSALQLQKVVMFLVLILITLVGGFNIISALIMNVIEKRREVAMLKAMGATRRSIGKIFFIQGSILGFTGTCLGLASGYLICILAGRYPLIRLDPDIYFLSHLPVEIRPVEFVAVGLVALLLTILSAVYPAWQAARLDPAEVLRYE